MLPIVWALSIFLYSLSTIIYPLSSTAQNMPREAGFLFAANGQASLVKSNDINRGFFTNPTIEHFYYSFETNGVQSLSIFLEHINETRNWSGIWTDAQILGGSKNFPASVSENLQVTVIGLETNRTLITASDFRLGAGFGLGFGLGGASADVTHDTTNITDTHTSETAWQALLMAASLRARYTIWTGGKYEIAIVALGRVWYFPYIGPIGSASRSYNGPGLRTLSEYGYLAGLAFGF
ncbi:MAG: hypothetical protein Q8922_03770 [Bacteroidota bacterium]|nr:hypothetical protein [Bacteroidota bacterium]MDP4233411.1 hypothetical protein [Bacteroidota bacterium]MDP4242277.1 hypothetical protein [Bacteroidota bacterium]MDP4287033.1 hypothetical protein [Bacteroidota bacterium]